MKLHTYEHRTQYYETDQMGIIHHSNYIRWFEEARTDLMRQMGIGYDEMEGQGIISPVLSVTCEYKSMTHFGETVLIIPILKYYNGIKMTIEYSVTDKESGELRCVGETSHCFLNREGKPVSLKKSYLEMDKMFQKALPQNEESGYRECRRTATGEEKGYEAGHCGKRHDCKTAAGGYPAAFGGDGPGDLCPPSEP